MNSILNINQSELAEICKDNDIVELSLFGSRARGKTTPESDIDLLVKFSDDKSLLEFIRLEKLLSEKLGSKVDLVTEDSISPYIKDYVLDDLMTLYGKNK